MKIDTQEAARGKRWAVVAGIVAIAFAGALFTVDEALSNSPRERILGNTLLELRTAQAGLSSVRPMDERLRE